MTIWIRRTPGQIAIVRFTLQAALLALSAAQVACAQPAPVSFETAMYFANQGMEDVCNDFVKPTVSTRCLSPDQPPYDAADSFASKYFSRDMRPTADTLRSSIYEALLKVAVQRYGQDSRLGYTPWLNGRESTLKLGPLCNMSLSELDRDCKTTLFPLKDKIAKEEFENLRAILPREEGSGNDSSLLQTGEEMRIILKNSSAGRFRRL